MASTLVVGAAPPSLYKSSAKRLIPTAAEAGFDQITSQSDSPKRATASYERLSQRGVATATVTIRVFLTDAAAKESYDASCPGCELRSFNGWRYKRLFEQTTVTTPGALKLVARCRNVRVDWVTAPAGKESSTRTSKLMIDEAIFAKAVRLGMTTCAGTPKPPPTTGSYYWTENHAEAIVLQKVWIPNCVVNPDDPQCRGRNAWGLRSAECRGLDEKPGTFTYSRFTCEIVVFGVNLRGRIAVWPTGPTTLRWRLL